MERELESTLTHNDTLNEILTKIDTCLDDSKQVEQELFNLSN